jgi:hypothetical protein
MTDREARERLSGANLKELHDATVAFRKANEEHDKRARIYFESGSGRALKRYRLAELRAQQTGALVRSTRDRLFFQYLGDESPVIVDDSGHKLVFFYEPVTRTWDTILDD